MSLVSWRKTPVIYVDGRSGLTQDVVMETREWRLQHQERLRFWSDIHNCWLVFLQKQFDVSQSVRSTKSSRSSNANMLSRSMLEELGDEVVRISDRLEAFGLVDYEMGFQERELITRECQPTVFNRKVAWADESK